METTTREDIKRWFLEGKKRGATHMIAACDTFDWSGYPIFVMPGEDVRQVFNECLKEPFTKIMEVYSLSKDMEEQLNEYRAFHFD